MKAHAKINIFLKILALDKNNYHILNSRFLLFDELYDELCLVHRVNDTIKPFELISNIDIKDNIVFKVYEILSQIGYKKDLDIFFKDRALKLIKNIPSFAGLGGASSDAACFLKMLNEELNLKLSLEKLYKIGKNIGSDVNFFLSGYKSANVEGIGEKIYEYDDEIPKISLIYPNIECSTIKVYEAFDNTKHDLFQNKKDANNFKKLSSKALLDRFENTKLNDLLAPCIKIYPKMLAYIKDDSFLSGSGSTLYEVRI